MYTIKTDNLTKKYKNKYSLAEIKNILKHIDLYRLYDII